jgi:CDP-paratose synthetase
MTRILITGATGSVGVNLIPYFLQHTEAKILTINRSKEKAIKLFGVDDRINHTTIQDIKSIHEFNPEVTIHLASFVTSSCDLENGKKLIESNILFGIALFEALRGCNALKLFLNFGTFAEYRMGTEKFDNAYLYSASKTAFRSFAEFYSKLFGFSLINIVPYTIYGTNDSKKKILDYIYDAFQFEVPVAMSPGNQILDFIHIDDVVRIINKLIFHKHIHHYHLQNIYLGTGKGTSVKEVVEIMKFILKKESKINWGGIPYRDLDVMYAVSNISKLIALNCIPKIDLKTGLEEFIQKKKNK